MLIEVKSTAHRFMTLSGREVFVMDGRSDFDLDALVAACHDASCRPPTSGGTGGSKPSGAAPKKVAHGPKVSGDGGRTWAEPMYSPSAFGKKVRDMVESDPLLSGRKTAAEVIAHLDGLKAAREVEARANTEEYLRSGGTGRSASQYEVQTGINYMYRDIPDALPTSVRVRDDIRNRLRAGEHERFVDDPNAPVRDKIDEAIRDAIVKQMAADLGTRTLTRTHVKVGDLDVMVEIRTPSAEIRSIDADRTRLDYESITPEFEAASTRVGKVIHDEIKSRVATQVGEAKRQFTIAASVLRDKGYNPDDLEVYQSSAGTSIHWKASVARERGLERMTLEQQAEIAGVMREYGLNGVVRDIHVRNAESMAQQRAYREVMTEILPMGGLMSGAPSYRKPKNPNQWSGNEQVIAGTSKYPSVWTELSNHRGPVDFKQTEGRAHYQDSVRDTKSLKQVSRVTLDGTVSTAVHELGHRYEYTVPGLHRLEELFHDRRTRGESAVGLGTLFPGNRYGRDERTYEDQFFDSYAGKVYPDRRAYELMTMGMEAVSMGKQGTTPKGPGKIDDEYQSFILGALVTLVKP